MKKLKQPDYPTWVCHTCGMDYGSWYKNGTYTGPPNICSTMHLGTCGVCGATDVAVTEPRDYGYLRAEWRHELHKNTKADKK
jgi:hypothetical protein